MNLVIVDVRIDDVEISKSGKSFTLHGYTAGSGNVEAPLDVFYSKVGSNANYIRRQADKFVAWHTKWKEQAIIRVQGTLERLQWQDSTGAENDRLRVIASKIEVSPAKKAQYSLVSLDGFVKNLKQIPETEFKKERASFFLGRNAKSYDDRVGYLSLRVSAFGDVANRTKTLKMKENSLVNVVGRFSVAPKGYLTITASSIDYATLGDEEDLRGTL